MATIPELDNSITKKNYNDILILDDDAKRLLVREGVFINIL